VVAEQLAGGIRLRFLDVSREVALGVALDGIEPRDNSIDPIVP
jgi:hypothetical protein